MVFIYIANIWMAVTEGLLVESHVLDLASDIIPWHTPGNKLSTTLQSDDLPDELVRSS